MKTLSWPSHITSKVLRACLTIAMVAFWTACSDNSPFGPDESASAAKGGGNETCTAGTLTSGRINYDPSSGEWTDQGGNLVDFGTLGFTIVVSPDGKYLSWSADAGICVRQVIIKGADAANIYNYDGEKSGDGLVSPGKGKVIPQISNITICWDTCGDVCYNYETAFGGNSSGSGAAWWFYFDPANGATQNIYAGQNLTDGSVTLDGGVFTINLGSWVLSGVKESVKIGGYSSAPSKRPAAGNYEKSGGTTLYKGTSIGPHTVASFPYYVIHLDVKQVVDCPE